MFFCFSFYKFTLIIFSQQLYLINKGKKRNEHNIIYIINIHVQSLFGFSKK